MLTLVFWLGLFVILLIAYLEAGKREDSVLRRHSRADFMRELNRKMESK